VQPSSNQPFDSSHLPSAPPVQLPPDPVQRPVDSALRLVITLMFVNLGLSVLTTIITLIVHNSVLDYELARTHLPADANPAQLDMIRSTLQTALWTKLVVTVLVAALYIWRAYSLRRGSRRAYLRLYYLCIAGLVGIAYLILGGQYPIWMRVEQGLQAAVLVALLVAVSRPQVRDRFAKRE
jgi:ABC-type Fe3+ transport system permease subunit